MESSATYFYLKSKGFETYRLFLRNYQIPVSIGVHEFEKANPQSIIFNVELWMEVKPIEDQIHSVVDYDLIRDSIKNLINRKHYELQETLCNDILDACCTQKDVLFAKVSTRKPDIYPDCDAVGCEIYRDTTK